MYRRTMPRVLRGSWGGGRFLMGEVPLYRCSRATMRGVVEQTSVLPLSSRTKQAVAVDCRYEALGQLDQGEPASG